MGIAVLKTVRLSLVFTVWMWIIQVRMAVTAPNACLFASNASLLMTVSSAIPITTTQPPAKTVF